MGWNQGYTIFEKTVILAYDADRLDRDLLSIIMEPYRGTDIDSGGSKRLKTKDGKDVRQVVIETWGLTMPTPPVLTGDEDVDELVNDGYRDEVYEQMDIVCKHFGWG